MTGDSKLYKEIINANIYSGYEIKKPGCVGHLQKRVGRRLRALKVSYKVMVLGDGKPVTGEGSMTDKMINTLQN